MQLPVITAHGVGFNGPSVPSFTALCTSLIGAEYIMKKAKNKSKKVYQLRICNLLAHISVHNEICTK